ncbi:MAG: ATP-dependent Clp protease adaptor ClpS [Parabacteroides sp.]
MEQSQQVTKEKQRTRLREPGKYNVIIHNDDFTSMDCVVMILKQVFFYDEEKANSLMLQVHHCDKAIVGNYTYDIAVSKAEMAIRIARADGYPLRLSVQPE